MLLSLAQGVSLAKRAAAWSKGLSLPGGAEQQSYGLLQSIEGSLVLTVRGPHGWLADSCDAELGKKDKAFEVGAMPAALLEELQRISGRDCVELTYEAKGDRHRLAFVADGYRRACLMDHLSGFIPEPAVALPEVDTDEATSIQLSASMLQELLQLSLLAAPSSEVNQSRAVVTLAFEEETVLASATDGFLLISARGELDDPVAEKVEIHLPTEAAARLYGLLSSVGAGDTVDLMVAASGGEDFLVVSFAEALCQALMPLPNVAGLPVKRILEGTKHRKSLAVVKVSPRTVSDLTACGLQKSMTLEADGKQLKAWSRADVDAAEDDAYVNVVITTEDCHEGSCCVDSLVLGKLIKALKGSVVDLQLAQGKGSPGLLVVEEAEEETAVTVMAAVILQNTEA